jgi:hypothetical protein
MSPSDVIVHIDLFSRISKMHPQSEPAYMSASDIVHGSLNFRSTNFRMISKFLLQTRHCMLDIHATGFIRIFFISDRLQDIVCNIPDVSFATPGKRCVYRTTACMAEHNDMPAIQMCRCILDTANLMVIKHIPCHADHKQFPDGCVKNLFRDYPGI